MSWIELHQNLVAGGYPQVDYYNNLPPASSNVGSIYVVLNSSGIWPFNRLSGFYLSNGTSWQYLGELTPSYIANLYESNPNTNKFTNAYKAILDNEFYVHDIVEGMFPDTNTIDVTVDDINHLINLEVATNSINTTHVDTISPLKIVDEQNQRQQATLITTGGLPTLIGTIDCSGDGMWLVEARLVARRIGGSAGVPGSGATLRRSFRIKTVAGVTTVHDYQSDYTSRDSQQFNMSLSEITEAVEIYVTGLVDNDIKWNLDLIINNNQ